MKGTKQMRRQSKYLWMPFVLAILAVASSATITTIDFNGGTTGVAIGGAYSGLGVTFTEGSWSPVIYPAYGIGVVSTSAVGWNPPFSPTAAVPITAVFSSPQSSVSIDGLDVGFNGVELVALNAGNGVVGFSTAFGVGAGVNNFVTLTVSGPGIVKAEWYEIGQVPGDGVLFDNLSFTSSVPEPASLMLLGTGLLTAVGAARRK